jgi:hypothetical protein
MSYTNHTNSLRPVILITVFIKLKIVLQMNWKEVFTNFYILFEVSSQSNLERSDVRMKRTEILMHRREMSHSILCALMR